MSYLGSSAAPVPVAFSGVRTQSFSGNGSTSLFTLSRAVTLVTDIEVIVNNVQQSPFDGSYSLVNNGLGLQFSENVSAGTNNIYVIYRDQAMGSLIDPTAVRKAGDTMTGTLTVGGNLLVSAESGGARTIGAASGTNTTVVIQGSTSIGGGPNIELTKDNVAYFDSNIIKFRSTDASVSYGGFDIAGRFTKPLQPHYVGDARSGGNLNAQTFTTWVHANTRINTGGHMVNGTFTCPVAGRYFVNFNALCRATSAHNIEIQRNGSVWVRSRDIVGTAGNEHTTDITSIVDCAANDTLRIQVQNESAGGDFYSEWNSTTIYLLG